MTKQEFDRRIRIRNVITFAAIMYLLGCLWMEKKSYTEAGFILWEGNEISNTLRQYEGSGAFVQELRFAPDSDVVLSVTDTLQVTDLSTPGIDSPGVKLSPGQRLRVEKGRSVLIRIDRPLIGEDATTHQKVELYPRRYYLITFGPAPNPQPSDPEHPMLRVHNKGADPLLGGPASPFSSLTKHVSIATTTLSDGGTE